MRLKRFVFTGILAALALVVFVAEAQIPPIVPLSGVKLGLSNAVTLIAIVCLGKKEGGVVLVVRLLLGNIFAGQAVSFLYGLTGGVLSYAVMCLFVDILSGDRLWAVSVLGALSHNFGQLTVAAFITKTPQVFWYAPVLAISGVISGAFVGLCVMYFSKHLKKIIGD